MRLCNLCLILLFVAASAGVAFGKDDAKPVSDAKTKAVLEKGLPKSWQARDPYKGGFPDVSTLSDAELTQRIARQKDSSLMWAREGFAAGGVGRFYSVLSGLSKHSSKDALVLLEAKIDSLNAEYNFIHSSDAARTWGIVYQRLNGEDSLTKAATEAADENLDFDDRALRVYVMATVGLLSENPKRAFALETYRPYLRSSHAELQRAALSVNSALWDLEAVNILKSVAHGKDVFNRSRADHLVRRYFQWGAEPPRNGGMGMVRSASSAKKRKPHDPVGARQWNQARPAWKREQDRLRGEQDLLRGIEPTPAMPEKPSFEIRRADTHRESNGEPLPLRP